MSRPQKKGEHQYAVPTQLQKGVINFLRSNTISILEGEAGTAKDFCCLYYALNELKNKAIDKVVITKPIVEVGRSMGYLPGSKQEKVDDYMQSFIANMEKIVGRDETRRLINTEIVEFQPINFCRGNTHEYSMIILSESQNCTLHELITFTTRAASTSKLLINGDLLQSDIKNSGLKDYIELLSTIEEIGYLYLGEEYQMRSPLIVDINRKYRDFLQTKY